ncbi:MAG: tetratricopeptide repeat protein [Bacteroidales bacterium]
MDENLYPYIINKVNVHEEEELALDSLLRKYPCDDLLISVKAFDMVNNLQKENATNLLDSCLKVNPKLSESTFFNWIKGFILNVEGETNKALDFFKKSYQMDDNKINPWVRLELYNHYSFEEPEKALKYLNESIEISEDYIDGWLVIGSIMKSEGQTDEALALYNDLLKKKELSYTYNAIGSLLLKLDDIDGALSFFEKSVEIKETADGYIGLGDIKFYYKQFSNALEYYKYGLDTKDCYHLVYSRIALTLIELNKLNEAKTYFAKALEDFQSEDNLSNYIYIHVLMGDLKKAEDYVGMMKNEYGVSSNSLFWELLILSLTGNLEEGQKKVDELYERLTDPEIEWVRQELSAWGVNIVDKPSH